MAGSRWPFSAARSPYAVAFARRAWSEEFGRFRGGLLVGSLVTRLLPSYTASRLRVAILRVAGVSIGSGTIVAGPLHLDGANDPRRMLSIGAHGFVNVGCRIDASAPVRIGDRVHLSQEVLVITNSHVLGDGHQRAGELSSAAVTIGDGCWVGARSTILPGVTIGDGAVVAAGAVVVDDVEPNTLVGGVPARIIRHLDGPDREAARGPHR